MFHLHALSLCLLSLLLLLLLLRLWNNFLSDGLWILILEMGFGFCMSLWYKVVDLFNFTLASLSFEVGWFCYFMKCLIYFRGLEVLEKLT
ncbi:hypothetical protein Ddye_008340 [Dipteronia dyeriana]|uniref:Uncharacterized protein n=1 Tax=Dipteronia dyeriana TaxID=168575 RepID=A0AAE0CLT7_9ROSI|nr:hypothetical protein Ddye_008340 [Dipteronia dyeriana]